MATTADTRSDGVDPVASPRAPDRGATLVEMLVTIVLMGLTVVSVLVALRVTTSASSIDEEHADAFEWLQAASDKIYQGQRRSCVDGGVREAYDVMAQAADRPAGWTSGTIAVTDVSFLGRSGGDDPFEWGPSYCFEGGTLYATSPLYTQKVTIQVTSPSGRIVKTLEMIKSE